VAGLAVDISLVGDKRLERLLRILPATLQKKVVRQALRRASKPVLRHVRTLAASYHNPATPSQNCKLLSRGLKVRSIKRTRRYVGVKIVPPPREYLGIPAGSRWYWPAHMELGFEHESGTPVAARSYLRKGTHEMRAKWLRLMQTEIRRGLFREARKARA